MAMSMRLLCVLLLAALVAAPVRAETPDPEITGLSATLALESDGWTRVVYRLEFVERSERERIPRWGPFESGFEVVAAAGTRDDETIPIRLVPAPDRCLAIRFVQPTREGSRYSVRLEYRFPGHPMLPARHGVRMFQWRPAAWDLAIRRTDFQVTLTVQVPENLAGDPSLCGEWARREGVVQVQPEPPAEGSGFHAVPDDQGRSWLAFRARWWGTLPRRAPGVTLYVPAHLVPEAASPAESELPHEHLPAVAPESRESPSVREGDRRPEDDPPLIHPRWIGLGAILVMLAAFAWIRRRGRTEAPASPGPTAPRA